MADRSDTHAPEETVRLKTPGPCQAVIFYGLYDSPLPENMANRAVRQEICGCRFWRLKRKADRVIFDTDGNPKDVEAAYYAECRTWHHRVEL
jgi:hypothetical protein